MTFISNLNVIKQKATQGLSLYFSSWKRSFDFESAPKDGEFANFIIVSVGILCALLGLFWGYDNYSFIEELRIITPGGLVIFWCYGAVALLPFAGLVARRLKQHDIEGNLIINIFNSLWIVKILVVIELLSLIVTSFSFFICTVAPYYVSLIILGAFCYRLKNMELIKQLQGYEDYKNKKRGIYRKILIGLTLLLVVCTRLMYVGVESVFICILFLFVFWIVTSGRYMFFLFLGMVVRLLVLCSQIVQSTLIDDIAVVVSISLFLLLYLIFTWGKGLLNSKKIQCYAALGFWMVLVPINVWSDASNLLRGGTPKEQNVQSIGDAKLNALNIPLLKTLVQKGTDKNYLVSAHNLYQGLAVLANGAEGETLQKLKEVLGSSSLEDINLKSKEIIKNHSRALKFDNKLFMRKKDLDKPFKEVLGEYFDMSVRAENATCSIDIKSKLQFSSLWKEDFDETHDSFYTPNQTIDVPMFEGEYEALIAQGEGFRVLAMQYKSGDIFYIILPDKEEKSSDLVQGNTQYSEALKNIVEKFDADTFRNLRFETHKLFVKIPEFQFTTEVSIKDILDDWGLGNLFIPYQAELGKTLSSEAKKDSGCVAEQISLGSFGQNNMIEVDKKGSKAISIQELNLYCCGDRMMGTGEAPFTVDRPFIFMINNGAFVGIVYNPRQK